MQGVLPSNLHEQNDARGDGADDDDDDYDDFEEDDQNDLDNSH